MLRPFNEYSHTFAIQFRFGCEVVVLDGDIGDISLIQLHINTPEDRGRSNIKFLHCKVDAHTTA